jgi:ABC-2 type transport system permease protein
VSADSVLTRDSSGLGDDSHSGWLAVIRAEWTKLRTVPGTTWLLAGGAALSIAVTVLVAAVTHTSTGPDAARQDPTKLALIGIAVGQAIMVVLAVLSIGEEYSTGMIHVTLVATPRRSAVLAAKAINVAGLTLVAGLIAVAGCLLAGRLMLPAAELGPDHGYPLISITHAATARAASGSMLYLILIALLALGIATAIRDTAASLGVVFALLYLPPLLAQAVSDPLRRHLEQLAPMTAGLAIQSTTNLHGQVLAPWAGLGVLAAWAAGSLAIADLLFRRRDA